MSSLAFWRKDRLTDEEVRAAWEVYEASLEALLAFGGDDRFHDDLLRSRAAHFAATGEIYEDDKAFDTRMIGFLERFVFDWPLEAGGTVAGRFVEERGGPPEVEGLTRSRWSLWEARHVRPTSMTARDVFSGQDLLVSLGRPHEGSEPGDLFEARLVPWGRCWFFTTAFCFHPDRARRPIRAALKRLKKARHELPEAEFLLALSKSRLKVDRYRNISIEGIYNLDKFGAER